MNQQTKSILVRLAGLILFAVIITTVNAQSANEKHSFRILWDNDYINVRGDGTDRYYTNGIRLDYFYTKRQKAKFPSSLLLNISGDNNNIYGVGMAQFMFTPRNINVADIQYNDRPYAGVLFSVHSLQSVDKSKNTKVTSEIRLGVIGPLSFAKETQKWVHSAFNYIKPLGWHNQVPNDIILNYNISLEKQMFRPSKKILVIGNIETYSGTVYNAASVGFMVRLGRFDNYLEDVSESHLNEKRRIQLSVFMKPTARVVLSNALLQGGLINQIRSEKKGYTLSKDQIERIVVLYDVGVIFEKQKYRVTISQKFIGPEFKGQYTQEFGNLVVEYKF